MRCTAQKSMSKTSFFVCEWLLQDCRPTNHVMTPLASPRAKARTHLGAATCLGPADATPPWGRLYKSRSLGPACPGPGASSVLSSTVWPPSSARIPARRGQNTTTDGANEQPSNTSLVPVFPGRTLHTSTSESAPKTSGGNNERTSRAVGSVSWLAAGCRLLSGLVRCATHQGWASTLTLTVGMTEHERGDEGG